MKNIFKYHWRAIAWVTIIFVSCLLPGDKLPDLPTRWHIPHLDKMVHCGMYLVFTLLLLAGFTRSYGKANVKAYLVSLLIALSCGAAVEVLQSFVGRSCDSKDLAANAVGAAIAVILYRPVKWMLRNIL
jgi:VanZ family protein